MSTPLLAHASSWAILTGEFPPDCGGVSDYTAQVAQALAAAGDDVTVYRPPAARSFSGPTSFRVKELPDRFGRQSRLQLETDLRDDTRILVQYVPNAFGSRGANLAFCRWLLRRRLHHGADIRVMFHEPYFYFGLAQPARNILAVAQRQMAATLLRASTRVYCSTDAWREYLAPYAVPPVVEPLTIAVPSSVPARCRETARVRERRSELMRGSLDGLLVGHLGTYGADIAPLLRDALVSLLRGDPSLSAGCIGAGSREFVRDLICANPQWKQRLHATGYVAADDAALTLASCDVVVQPYPDGVTTRRTSTMAALVNERAVVTTDGPLTEPVWRLSESVALARVGNVGDLVHRVRALLDDKADRVALGQRGADLYRHTFALEHTIARLRDVPIAIAA